MRDPKLAEDLRTRFPLYKLCPSPEVQEQLFKPLSVPRARWEPDRVFEIALITCLGHTYDADPLIASDVTRVYSDGEAAGGTAVSAGNTPSSSFCLTRSCQSPKAQT